MFAAQILVLIPHPDDEVVGCAAAIRRATRRGCNVAGLYLTNGVPAREQFWPWQRRGHAAQVVTRWREAEAAGLVLGLTEAGRQDVPTRTLRRRMAETARLVEHTLDATGATVIWVPAFEGGHQDHDVTNALASRLRTRVAVWEFSEYHNDGGRVHTQEFIEPVGNEVMLTLDSDEITVKRRALEIYASERSNLGYVGVEREAFRPLADYDYATAPHSGVLFHARYRWVWGHPRVDRTDPREVRRDIAAFLTAHPSSQPPRPATGGHSAM